MNLRWCKHFRGSHNKETCEAGVRFDAVRLTREQMPKGLLIPCLHEDGCKWCDKHSLPTAEEVAAYEAEVMEYSLRCTRAKHAIVAHRKATGATQGKIECPTCKGSLRFSIAPNNHVAARCETPQCLAFME